MHNYLLPHFHSPRCFGSSTFPHCSVLHRDVYQEHGMYRVHARASTFFDFGTLTLTTRRQSVWRTHRFALSIKSICSWFLLTPQSNLLEISLAIIDRHLLPRICVLPKLVFPIVIAVQTSSYIRRARIWRSQEEAPVLICSRIELTISLALRPMLIITSIPCFMDFFETEKSL